MERYQYLILFESANDEGWDKRWTFCKSYSDFRDNLINFYSHPGFYQVVKTIKLNDYEDIVGIEFGDL